MTAELTKAEQKTLAQIERLITDAKPFDSKVFEITPGIAEALLERFRGDHNRPLKDPAIRDYAEDMRNGEWKLNGEPIQFSDEALLLDGQHRLNACKLAGVPFKVVLMFMVPHETFNTINQGRLRTAADILAIGRVPYPTVTAPAIKYAEAIDSGHTYRQFRLSTREVLGLAKSKYKDLPDWFDEARHVQRTYRYPVAMLMALFWLFDNAGPNLNAELIERLANRKPMDGHFHLILRLDETIKRRKNEMLGGQVPPMVIMAMWVKMWNAIIDGNDKALLRWVPKLEGGVPAKFPEIKRAK